jgi:hypothetical protein
MDNNALVLSYQYESGEQDFSSATDTTDPEIGLLEL